MGRASAQSIPYDSRKTFRNLALGPGPVGPAESIRGPPIRDLIFCQENGHPINPETFSEAFARHARAAGLPPIRLHDVRHSYATAALEAGIPAKVVSEWLGHAGIAITLDHYSHVLPKLDEQSTATVANLILGTPLARGAQS